MRETGAPFFAGRHCAETAAVLIRRLPAALPYSDGSALVLPAPPEKTGTRETIRTRPSCQQMALLEREFY